MPSTKFQFIWESGFRGEDFLEINQSETIMACGVHVCLTDRDEMNNLYRGPSLSIDASYQVLVYLAKRFQRRRFLEIYQPEI